MYINHVQFVCISDKPPTDVWRSVRIYQAIKIYRHEPLKTWPGNERNTSPCKRRMYVFGPSKNSKIPTTNVAQLKQQKPGDKGPQ